MEYRGYDSAGLPYRHGGRTVRRAGRLLNLEERRNRPGRPRRDVGDGPHPVGDPRPPHRRNAHPHRDAAGEFAVAHNGIIENFAVLRAELEAAGVEFASDTDSEVAVHLVVHAYRERPAGDFVAAVG